MARVNKSNRIQIEK